MAVRDLRARVAIDGEKEYKAAIEQLNAGNKTLKSEMALLQAQYKGNADSMEYLTAKGELLTRQLAQQQAKTQETREMYQKSADAYAKAIEKVAAAEAEGGEALAQAQAELAAADKKMQHYAQQLNNAQAEEYNLQHTIEENTEAMQGQGETMEGLGDTIEGVASKLGIKIPDGAKNALNSMKGLSAGTVAAMAAAATAIAALVEGVKQLHQMTLEAAAEADDIITKSMTTGLSTTTLQQLKYAENLIDVSVDTITGSLTKLTKNMKDALDGNESLSDSFKELGVSITYSDGTLRNAEDVFYDLIDALGNMDNATERDAISMSLLGKSAQDLNPLILQGSEALRELAEEAENTGYVLDESQIAKLGEVDDAYQRMQLTLEATKKQLASDFAPASTAAMELFTKAVQKAAEFLEKSGLIENLATIIGSLLDIIGSVGEIIAGIPGLQTALQGLNVVLGGVAQLCAVIADSADLVKSMLSLDLNGMKNALGFGYNSGNANHYQTVYMQQSGTYGEYQSWFQNGQFVGHNAAGTDYWRGGLTWVGENGPELAQLPAGTQILSNQESRAVGGDTFYVTIDAKSVKEFNDIVQLAQSARVRERMR